MNSRKRSQSGDGEPRGERQQPTKKKRVTKKMNKTTAKTLQNSLKCIATNVLVDEAVASLKEQFSECHGLSAFVDEMCKAEEVLNDIIQYHRDTFSTLHSECKKEKNSQLQFQLKWHSYCSAFLLEEKHTLDAINLEEAIHPVLTNLREKWLQFCKGHSRPVPESNPAMMALSSAVYNSMLEHVSSFQACQSGATESSCGSVTEEDGVYYRFGGGALCEMLHRRYKQISSAKNKNLMSIEISILQAINTKDKSDIPDYLQYRDRGFMYFPHKVFIPFLQKVDLNLKKVINSTSFNEHGDNLIKVSINSGYISVIY